MGRPALNCWPITSPPETDLALGIDSDQEWRAIKSPLKERAIHFSSDPVPIHVDHSSADRVHSPCSEPDPHPTALIFGTERNATVSTPSTYQH